jgi:hypothetical protein
MWGDRVIEYRDRPRFKLEAGLDFGVAGEM